MPHIANEWAFSNEFMSYKFNDYGNVKCDSKFEAIELFEVNSIK